MKQEAEYVLADCLRAIEEGRLSIDECRRALPQQWAELQRLLLLAGALRQAPRVIPSLTFRRQARQRLLLKITPHASSHRISRAPQLERKPAQLFRLNALRPSLNWLLIFLAIFFMATGVGVAYASNDILPGDALYTAEIGFEKLQLLLSRDPSKTAQLQIRFAQERVGEMRQLAEKGRFEDIPQATMIYQAHLDGANSALRELVIQGDSRAHELGALLEEAMLYDSLLLSGLSQSMPDEIRAYMEAAIGASRAGRAIARQWVNLLMDPNSQSPIPSSAYDDYPGFPTDISCWPADLQIAPPQGVPFCEEGQTPVPLPKDLPFFCWPVDIPFDPPQGIPLCTKGQFPILLPRDLELLCWPAELPYRPPEGMPICEEGQLPVALPDDLDLACWPSQIPYQAPQGIPICEPGREHETLPAIPSCWPKGAGSNPPAGIPTCEPNPINTLPGVTPGALDFQLREMRDALNNILPQFTSIRCWPSELGQNPNPRIPVCQPNELPLPIVNGIPCWPSQLPLEPPPGIPACNGG